MRRAALACVLAVACTRPAPRQVGGGPLTDAAIATFVANGADCEWRRIDGRSNDLLATIPGSCDGVWTAWNADGTKALLAKSEQPFRAVIAGAPPRTFQVGPEVHRVWLWSSAGVAALARPPRPMIAQSGFDATGVPALTALVAQTSGLWSRVSSLAGRSPDCVPSLLFRHRYAEERWILVKEEDIACGDPQAPGELEPLHSELPRLQEFRGDRLVDGDLLHKLESFAPMSMLVSSNELAVPRGERNLSAFLKTAGKAAANKAIVYVEAWGAAEVGGGLTIARREREVVFVRTGIASRPQDPPPEITSVVGRGHYLLLTDEYGTHPRLYDLRDSSLVWKSDGATGTTFWPKPATE